MFSFFRKLCKHKDIKDNRLICSEAFDTVTVQADGTITCGCGDIYEGRSLGNINNSSLSEIFNNCRSGFAAQKLNRESIYD